MRRRVRIDVGAGEGSPPGRRGGVAAGAPPTDPPRVLFVERDSFLAALTRATLDDAGFQVEWFRTAQAAVASIREAPYDVCLLPADCLDAIEAASVRAVAALARSAEILLVGDEPCVEPIFRRYRLLPRRCHPRLLAEAVDAAARSRREAA